MTAPAATTDRPAPADRSASADAPVRRRRRHRWAIPLGIAAALFIVTGVTHAIDQPDPTEDEFLSPVSEADTGASRLADMVRQRGVTVQRMTTTPNALVAADAGNATLLVTAPEVVHPLYLRMLRYLPGDTRVVLVEPQARELSDGRLPVTAGGRRWAAAALPPDEPGPALPPKAPRAGCALPEARSAGVAAVHRQRYAEVGSTGVELTRCYADGLVGVRWGDTELVLVGASDPFRNDRIGEHGNAALATALLTGRPRLVWLDLHKREPPPGVDPNAVPGEGLPSLAPGDGGPGGDFGGGGPGDGQGDGGRRGDGSGPDGDNQAPPLADPENPLWRAFPPWFWALLAQLALAALLVALWRARRLGPPVSEPLPVLVRSAETVLGRGRLYHRARARGPALDVLRRAALTRLSGLLDLPPGDELVEAVAATTGRDVAEVDALLYGAEPDKDEDLVRIAGELEALLHAVAAPRAGRDGGDDR